MWPSAPRIELSSSKPVVVDISDDPIPEDDLILIYRWLDTFSFSRIKKVSPHRDFADGVLMAELVAHHIPRIINLLNYIPASATARKMENWEHLNSKIFKRIRFQLTPELIKQIVASRPGMIERVLFAIHNILMLGPLAVIPVSNRLEHVKSRFMNIQRTFNKVGSRAATAIVRQPRSSDIKSRSGIAPQGRLLRVEDSQQPRPITPARRTVTETPLQALPPAISVLDFDTSDTNNNVQRCNSKGILSRNRTNSPTVTGVAVTSSMSQISPNPNRNQSYVSRMRSRPKNQYVVHSSSRPATGSSSDILKTCPPRLRPQTASPNVNSYHQLYKDKSNNASAISVGKNTEWNPRAMTPAPRSNSWLQTNEENGRYTNAGVLRMNGNTNQCIEDDDYDDEVDDVIYCNTAAKQDSTESTQYQEGDADSVSKRKLKRVRQYEYREEYQFNGVPVASVVYRDPPIGLEQRSIQNGFNSTKGKSIPKMKAKSVKSYGQQAEKIMSITNS